MDSIYIGMHIIDRLTENAINKPIDEEDAQRYIATITNTVVKNKNHKQYKITKESTKVVATIKRIFARREVLPSDSDLIARRLLEKEIDAQEKVSHLDVEIKKGSLIQSFFTAFWI